MKRIVCDTNIYISSFLFPKSTPATVLGLARMGLVELYVSPFILDEIQKILQSKFYLSKTQITELIKLIKKHSLLIEPQINISIIRTKHDDNRILECAVYAKADYLVTGDKKHILPLEEYGGVKICSPAEFLKRKLWN